jgi:hypothetical protein
VLLLVFFRFDSQIFRLALPSVSQIYLPRPAYNRESGKLLEDTELVVAVAACCLQLPHWARRRKNSREGSGRARRTTSAIQRSLQKRSQNGNRRSGHYRAEAFQVADAT